MAFFHETFSSDSILLDLTKPLADGLSAQDGLRVLPVSESLIQMPEETDPSWAIEAIDLFDNLTGGAKFYFEGFDDVLANSGWSRYVSDQWIVTVSPEDDDLLIGSVNSRTRDATLPSAELLSAERDSLAKDMSVATGAQPTDAAGNSLVTARHIGVLDSRQTFQDFVGTTDTDDYYRFSFTERSTFSLALTDLSTDTDVELLNSDGKAIAISYRGGNSSESILLVLEAGDYYVRVYPFSVADTGYRLTLNATEATDLTSFSSIYGYGLINAADAVATALGQTTPLPDVTNLGGNSWGLDTVNVPEAWAQGYTGENVVVAVIDSGVDINHVDLRDNIWVNTDEIPNNGIDDDDNGYIDDDNGWNFGLGQNNNNVLPGTNDPSQGHGTHVAGTIAAANNGIGVTGVAHEASIMAIRMGDVAGGRFVNPGNLADAIRYAVDNGADVINMSLGWTDSAELQDALAYAANNDVITVSAAGNGDATGNGLPFVGSPAQYATQYGISVGAVDMNQDIAGFSNRPSSNSAIQHVVAPGVGIYSTRPNNTYGFSSGTSMASPHVAGVVALMLDANPELTHDQVRQLLAGTSVRLG